MENIFYVYEWIRLDTNEPFYVGKGKGRRAFEIQRGNNKYFYNILNKTDVAVYILEENLSEKEAYQIECYYINEYKYKIGYNLTNICDGGEGVTLLGEKNPMYGRTWWDENTPIEKINKWKLSTRNFGENNGNFRREYTDEERKRMSEGKKGKFLGKNNPNYGNDTLKRKYADNPKLKILNSRKGKVNGRSIKVFIYKDDVLFREFDYIGECSKWLIENKYTTSNKVKSVSAIVSKSIKENKEYRGFKFFCEKISNK